MTSFLSADRVRFLLRRFRERLWVKPLAVCLFSIAAAFVAKLADGTGIKRIVPDIAADSVEALLSNMATSMLVIATLSVTSMVSAYASASSTATPRSFALVVADDASQNALSTFVGAFIFSIVALTAVKNEYFGKAGLFILFSLTICVFCVVIVTFVRWVDRIARLGRVGSTVEKVEAATAGALTRRRRAPTLHAAPARNEPHGIAVFATRVGYVQHIDIAELQSWAEKTDALVHVASLPGTFVAPGRPLAYINTSGSGSDNDRVAASFEIGAHRIFDDDPRFGLVVLSEIAGRALSPAVNDPGTAIVIIGTLVRLFALWSEPVTNADSPAPKYDRVTVPEVSVQDMFDDAFTAIARDGAGTVEVSVRLQKALQSLASIDNAPMRIAARRHSVQALERARIAMELPADLAAVREAGRFGVC